jgi:hypothetical protein
MRNEHGVSVLFKDTKKKYQNNNTSVYTGMDFFSQTHKKSGPKAIPEMGTQNVIPHV